MMNLLNETVITKVVNAREGKTKIAISNDIDRKDCGIRFTLSGRTVYYFEGREIVADKNHVILFPSNIRYRYKCPEFGQFYVLNFVCSEGFVDEITSIELDDPRTYWADCEKMKTIFKKDEYRAELLSLLYGVIAKLAAASRKGEVLHSAIAHMEANYSDPNLSNSILAKKVNISDSHFRSLFKAAYDITPHKYLIKLRIRQAKLLLYNPDLSIAEIAESCGFSSALYFSKAFKTEVGISPTKYRHNADHFVD